MPLLVAATVHPSPDSYAQAEPYVSAASTQPHTASCGCCNASLCKVCLVLACKYHGPSRQLHQVTLPVMRCVCPCLCCCCVVCRPPPCLNSCGNSSLTHKSGTAYRRS
jgi:hypothetical protein